jgi:hypothetical protein
MDVADYPTKVVVFRKNNKFSLLTGYSLVYRASCEPLLSLLETANPPHSFLYLSDLITAFGQACQSG